MLLLKKTIKGFLTGTDKAPQRSCVPYSQQRMNWVLLQKNTLFPLLLRLLPTWHCSQSIIPLQLWLWSIGCGYKVSCINHVCIWSVGASRTTRQHGHHLSDPCLTLKRSTGALCGIVGNRMSAITLLNTQPLFISHSTLYCWLSSSYKKSYALFSSQLLEVFQSWRDILWWQINIEPWCIVLSLLV